MYKRQGRLTIDGDYTQGATSSLQIDVSGSESGDFDEVIVTGNVTLNGSLAVVVASEFTPSVSDPAISFVTFATSDGEFSSTELAGYELQPTNTSLSLAFTGASPELLAISFDDERDSVFAEPEVFETEFDELIEVSI